MEKVQRGSKEVTAASQLMIPKIQKAKISADLFNLFSQKSEKRISDEHEERVSWTCLASFLLKQK